MPSSPRRPSAASTASAPSIKAVRDNDLPLLLGVVLVAAAAIVVANIVVDAVYALIDPRVRLA